MVQKLVFGVGLYTEGKFCSKINGKIPREYQLWTSMLRRCYSEEYLSRNPSYRFCEVSDNFKNFQYFAEWCQHQIGFGVEGYQLDKDSVFKGNKVYGEDTCFFIPKHINQFFTKGDRIRGEFPVGVSFSKTRHKFITCANDGYGKSVYLGGYDTAEQAFRVYKNHKELLAKSFANMYNGILHPTVVQTLNNYVVEIID